MPDSEPSSDSPQKKSFRCEITTEPTGKKSNAPRNIVAINSREQKRVPDQTAKCYKKNKQKTFFFGGLWMKSASLTIESATIGNTGANRSRRSEISIK